MRAVTLPAFGGPEALTWADVPDPVPGPGEALIRVAAAGVNRADLLQRQGHYPPPPGASPLPGLEVSGTVVALGPGLSGPGLADPGVTGPAAGPGRVTDPASGTTGTAAADGPLTVPAAADGRVPRIGDEVCALLAGGGYAELVAVPVPQLMPVPAGVDLIDAAALPEATCTVWSNLVDAGRLRSGETVLVHGGTGGIGTTAIQVARLLGARVVTSVGSAAKADAARALGADVVVRHDDAGWPDAVKAVTDGRGVDLILDVMGASALRPNMSLLAADGRLVVIGLQGGRRAEIDLGLLLARRLSVIGTTLRARSVVAKGAICRDVVTHVWPAIAAGRITPVVDRRLPMRDAAEAHRVLESGARVGKVLLVPGQ
jgi:putative PIG3 family NAD(P)H quinone oxidoreductase